MTKEKRGASSATKTTGRCTTARSASIRKISENVYVGGLNFSKSTDGGKTFRSLQAGIAHVDNHAIWINPANSDHMLLGNDGGLNVSYDQGATWEFVNTIPAAQFYAIGVDMRKPYYVYGGLQDNGSWGGPSQTRNQQRVSQMPIGIVSAAVMASSLKSIRLTTTSFISNLRAARCSVWICAPDAASVFARAVCPRPEGWTRAGGATPAASPSPGASPTPDTAAQLAAFAAAQGFGGFGGATWQSNVVPTPPPNEIYRFYWNTPIHLSPHNPRVV